MTGRLNGMTGDATPVDACAIRSATAADIEAVTSIWHEGWRDGHLGHVPEGLVAHRQEAQFLTRARARIASMWVAEAAGAVVGFVTVKGDELEHLYVDRAARGTGVAAMLLRAGEREIRGAGHRRAWLAVVAGNQRARAFYARSGWRDAGPFTYMAETMDGLFPIPSHRYEIDLPGDGGDGVRSQNARPSGGDQTRKKA
jgi:ribosomal protein S18 acetylase RimI-like enzyme